MPATNHLIFYRSDALPDAQTTVSKHGTLIMNINRTGNTTELFLRAEDVEARLTDDLTEQLQQHVVVSLFN